MTTRFADAVIVAAGSSTRMGGIDKLTAPLHGKPLLQWSVEAMKRARSVARIYVVTRPDRVDEFRHVQWLADLVGDVIPGGPKRSDSVRAGVERTTEDVVLVHDGARPLVSSVLADAVAEAAHQHGAAIPVLPVADALKRATAAGLASGPSREGVVRAQTPQGARRQLLVEAFRHAGSASFPDEAALLEAAGISVAAVAGEASNIKVTATDDLELVRRLAGSHAEERTGFGEDVHGFGPDDGLVLGGVAIPHAPRLHGHSDGDVVLHAIATAILSAAGLGDLGRLFPSSDRRTAGIDSSTLLGEAVRRADEAGWAVDRAHISLVGARPRLGAQRLDAMRSGIADLLGVGEADVSVVASSGNLYGAEGAGRAIRASAVLTLVSR